MARPPRLERGTRLRRCEPESDVLTCQLIARIATRTCTRAHSLFAKIRLGGRSRSEWVRWLSALIYLLDQLWRWPRPHAGADHIVPGIGDGKHSTAALGDFDRLAAPVNKLHLARHPSTQTQLLCATERRLHGVENIARQSRRLVTGMGLAVPCGLPREHRCHAVCHAEIDGLRRGVTDSDGNRIRRFTE